MHFHIEHWAKGSEGDILSLLTQRDKTVNKIINKEISPRRAV